MAYPGGLNTFPYKNEIQGDTHRFRNLFMTHTFCKAALWKTSFMFLALHIQHSMTTMIVHLRVVFICVLYSFICISFSI